MPVLNKNTAAYVFYDYGSIYGENQPEDHILSSTGVGIKTTINRNIYANLSVGIPLKKDYNGFQTNSSRVHLIVSGQF